ncbi:MAG: Hsp20/alpha crystallin family protein [bacterium]
MLNKPKISITAELEGGSDLEIGSVLPDSHYNLQAHEPEGQLAVDVAQTDEELIIVATMAGTSSENISLHLHNDLLTIRGERVSPVPSGARYCYEETYWGRFSRTIILPADVKYEEAQAQYKNGVLTVRLLKRNVDNKIQIMVVDE